MKYNQSLWDNISAFLKAKNIKHIVLIHDKFDNTMFAYNIFTHKPITINKLANELRKLFLSGN